MTELKDMDNGIVITPFVSLKEKQEVIRTLHKTLDGRQLISRFGEPAVSYELTVYVKEDGRQALFSSEDQLSLLRVTLGGKVYFGRIIKLSEFDRISREYFKADHRAYLNESVTVNIESIVTLPPVGILPI